MLVRPLTDICPVDEAKQIEERHSRHDKKVYLPAEPGLGLGVELRDGLAIPETSRSVAASPGHREGKDAVRREPPYWSVAALSVSTVVKVSPCWVAALSESGEPVLFSSAMAVWRSNGNARN